MCGITGSLSFSGQEVTPRTVLRAMGQALVHRGPDECGLWTEGPIGLASQRLRVVDLVTGQQPLTSKDGRFHLVANGEIYNADALRERLQAQGCKFTTRTDVEVLLYAYAEEGPACLDRIEGMFAFAVWDEQQRTLFLARDRFGEKPLYHVRLPHGFLFASELKALLAHPHVSRELDWTAVVEYLVYGYVPGPRAIFRSVRKLPPAYWLLINAGGQETLHRYWEPPCPPFASGKQPDTEEATEEILTRLRASVQRRTICDVPWGVFLSGGIDSSLVAALAAEVSPTPIKTFAIGFEQPSYDERVHAATVAHTLGAEHHELVLTGVHARALLPDVARIFDEPFADASSLPAVLLARLAQKHVTVALSGDGGDELFCGYPTQTAHIAAECYRRLPSWLSYGISVVATHLPTSHAYLSWDFALRRFLRDAAHPTVSRHLRWMGHFSSDTLPSVLTSAIWQHVQRHDPYAQASARIKEWGASNTSDIATGLDLMFYLAEDNLLQADRASMSTALEVRAPFLDRALADYALSLPASLRRGVWRTKPLLRRAAQTLLPVAITRRPKHGFGVPTGLWLRKDLQDLVRDALEPRRLHRQGIFEPTYVAALLRQHIDGVANYAKELWTLFLFQLWMAVYLNI